MAEIKEKVMNICTYLFTGAGILANTESIEKFILFVGGCVLLFLQIRLHLIKIKKERNCEENNKKKDLED